MFRRALVVSTLLLLADPATIGAQRFEVAPYIGYRLGNVGALLLVRYLATFFNSGDQYFCLDGATCSVLPSSGTFQQFEISDGVSVAF